MTADARSKTAPVQIGLVLPDVMGTYGDGGNAVVLRQRLRLRGIDAEIVEITLNDPVPDSMDLYTLGGAEDYAQRLASRHLLQDPGLQGASTGPDLAPLGGTPKISVPPTTADTTGETGIGGLLGELFGVR